MSDADAPATALALVELILTSRSPIEPRLRPEDREHT